MGLSTIPVFDCPDVWLPTAEWKTLTKAIGRLHVLCDELQVTSLAAFQNASRGMVSEEEAIEIEEESGAEFKGDHYYLPDSQVLWSIKNQWFNPFDGLKTTKAPRVYLENNPRFWMDEERDNLTAEGMLEVVIALDWALEKGQRVGCQFHLEPLC